MNFVCSEVPFPYNPFTNEVLVVIGKGSGITSLPGDARANLTVSPQSCTI